MNSFTYSKNGNTTKTLLLLLIYTSLLLAAITANAHSIAYVHIGQELPSHIHHTISQARLFNPDCPIYLIANQSALEADSAALALNNVEGIACESLQINPKHKKFQHNPSHDWSINGFWVHTTERFFYLEEFIKEYELYDVFHMENDIMLYADLTKLMPVFKKYYNGMIGATFENDARCVPGFLYIADSNPLTALVDSFPDTVNVRQSDMELLANFKNNFQKIFIDYLPIIQREYALEYPLKAYANELISTQPECYSNHIEEFGSIFDAAAFGVFLGGMDSRLHYNAGPGKIDIYCVFNPTFFSINWKFDERNRKIPFVSFNGNELPINNLHITNKSIISSFSSISLAEN